MTHIDFIGNFKKYCILSIVLVAVILAATIFVGPQLAIEFKGGSIITYTYDGEMDIGAFQNRVQELTAQEAAFQQSKDLASGIETIVVSLPGSRSLNADQMISLSEGLAESFPENNPRTVSINNVDPTIGAEFLAKSLVAVAVASLLIIIFVAFRFRKIGGLSAGVMAVIALLHDVIIVYGVFIIFRISIDANFIAVVLTILGYSVNDTIVIYDRVRENRRLMGTRAPLADLVNTSINQSFRRSLNTSITTVLAMVVVTIVAMMYNVTSIISFSFPMILGLISGAYSSICIAGPLWVKWRQHKMNAQAA